MYKSWRKEGEAEETEDRHEIHGGGRNDTRKFFNNIIILCILNVV